MGSDVTAKEAMLSESSREAVRKLMDFMDEKGSGYEQWRVCITADPCEIAVDIILAGRVSAGEWTCKQTVSNETAREAAAHLKNVLGVNEETAESQTGRFVMLYREID